MPRFAFHLIAGDLEPDLDLQVSVNGEVEDLSDCSALVLLVMLPDGTREEWALAGLDLDTGKVRHQWVAGETDQVGRYEAQIQATRGNGELQTFPSTDQHIVWNVHERLT